MGRVHLISQETSKLNILNLFRIKNLLIQLIIILTIVSAQNSFPQSSTQQNDDQLGTLIIPITSNTQSQVQSQQKPDQTLTQAELVRKENLLQQYQNAPPIVKIDSIQPRGGPTTGETRIIVRGGPFKDMYLIYPHPKCKFGKKDRVVNAIYVTCTEKPLATNDIEGARQNRDSYCLQCESSPPVSQPGIVSILVSLTGDFSDSEDSENFRYYLPPKITGIYPRYGKKDGNTKVQVWGENFLNFDEQVRCGFGSKSVAAEYKSQTYMECWSPSSDVVGKPIPFTVSMNSQQNTKENINYWYYNQPIVSSLKPNFGVDKGGNKIQLLGSNFHPFDWVNDIDNQNDTFCNFKMTNQQPVPMVVTTSTTAYCVVPENFDLIDVTNVDIALNNVDYTDDQVQYFFYRPSQITNIEPKEGPTRGNTLVTVYGIDFATGKKIICKFGDVKTRGKFISMGEIQCLSPPTQQPGIVKLTIAYDGDDDKFSTDSFDYLYYNTPSLFGIEPTCGPITGQTQIILKGQNFIDMGFGKAKCIFNGTLMNATIIDAQTIKCSSPPLNADQSTLDAPDLKSIVQVTLNGKETTTENIIFNYYPELKILKVNRNSGPIQGQTTSILEGLGFSHPNVCNLSVRYGAIEVIPILSNDTLITKSPAVSVPDSVTLFPSGNKQNYAPDYTLHFRDIENTFNYYQDIYIQDIKPNSGPSTGSTKIIVKGYGMQQFKYDNGTKVLVIPQVRFVDQTGNVINQYQSPAINPSQTQFIWYTPASTAGMLATLQISYNGEYWQSLLTQNNNNQGKFLYYNAANIASIVPKYGPVKITLTAVINGNNFQCGDPNCQNILVRFGSEQYGTIVSGKWISSSQIQVQVPAYTKPDVLPIDISFNGVDFTKSNLTYGYFDPFILNVQPKLISSSKSTNLTIKGFGFINPDNQNDLKVKFTSPQGDLTCGGVSPCITSAFYVDKNTIQCSSQSMNQLSYSNGNLVALGDPIWVEVSLQTNQYTNNQISIYYYGDLTYNGVDSNSVPKNLGHPILIDTNFNWDLNSLPQFQEFSNFTCMFVIGDETVIVKGRLETVPFGAQYASDSTFPTHVSCSTPEMHNSGQGILKISPNGQDYTGQIPYEFQAALDLYRILPQCGPKEGQTKVMLIGNGFNSQKDAVFSKFGVLQVQELQKAQVLQMAWSLVDWLSPQLMTEGDLRSFEHKDHLLKNGDQLSSIVVQTPTLQQTRFGGPVYVSIGQQVNTNMIDLKGGNQTISISQYYFSNSLVEYYYYKSPQIVKIEPLQGLTTGGTPIEVSGLWFDYKIEYGLVPHCKIGEKIIRGSFSSTVRIICTTPPNDNTLSALPIKISLNGVDWIESGFQYSYYKQYDIKNIFPKSGQMNGGTNVYITGDNFSSIISQENTRCRWILIDNMGGLKRDRIIQYTPARILNETVMTCVTPSSFIGGDRAFVQITFNNKDYSAQNENLIFSFYSIESSFPQSGPANALNEVISIRGAGFKPDSKIFCHLNETDQEPIEITENLIKCPMTWPGKNPRDTGLVKFGMQMDGGYTDFGKFYYYYQIDLTDVSPRYGPAEGKGIITLYGNRFRDDFPNAQLSCKVGDNIGDGELIDSNTMRCVVESMNLVNLGDSLPVFVSLNKYSWVGEQSSSRLLSTGTLGYVPYGVETIFPESGVMEGFTDIMVTGKGFQDQIANKAKCRFGVDGDSEEVEAQVLDYTKLYCRTPQAKFVSAQGSKVISVPFSISFGENEVKPWTKDYHRFRFYTQPMLDHAVPNEIDVRKKTEIYVYAQEGDSFLQPVPTGQIGTSNYNSNGGVTCSFEDFGKSMGTYLNQTTMLCLSPHLPGTSDDYVTKTVTVAIAMNGQDFLEDSSNAEVTFIGTGSSNAIFHFVLSALLIALLIVAILTCLTALIGFFKVNNVKQNPNVMTVTTLRDSQGGNTQQRGFNSQGYKQNNPNSRQLNASVNSFSYSYGGRRS